MFYKKNKESIYLYSCVDGITRQLRDVKDTAFSIGSMGEGVVVYPTSNNVYSPVEGTIKVIFNTNHCLGIKTDNGFELLIHIGIDTIKMQGEGFKTFVNEGDKVEIGTKLFEVDFELIKKNNHPIDVLLMIKGTRNSVDIVEEIEPGLEVKSGDLVMKAILND